MCRWLAYSGSPILLEELLYKPDHSLIDQSLHARLGVDTTNGDGFGVGWYGANSETPAVFRSIEPAWNDRNLREVAGHVECGLFLAHIRASTGTAVQQTNCHPFRYGRWIWVHNGMVRDFARLKRDLALAVDESLYASIEGSDRKSTRLNSSHANISYAVFCLKKKSPNRHRRHGRISSRTSTSSVEAITRTPAFNTPVPYSPS